jgi:hypothetical protein
MCKEEQALKARVLLTDAIPEREHDKDALSFPRTRESRRPRGPSCWPGRLPPVRRRSRTTGKSARLRGVLDSRVRGNDMNAPLGGGVRPFPKLQPMIVAPRLDTRVRGYDKREN